MKKFMFSALACVAFAFSGFASNEVVSEMTDVKLSQNIQNEKDLPQVKTFEEAKKPCSVRLIGWDAYGRSFDTTFNYTPTTSDGCDQNKKNKVAELEFLGAKIEKSVVSWG